MTKDEIIEMVQFCFPSHREMWCVDGHLPRLERFAKLVAQHEREACWNDISIALLGSDRELTKRVFKAIRARGQA
jgi:hypothetical protein